MMQVMTPSPSTADAATNVSAAEDENDETAAKLVAAAIEKAKAFQAADEDGPVEEAAESMETAEASSKAMPAAELMGLPLCIAGPIACLAILVTSVLLRKLTTSNSG